MAKVAFTAGRVSSFTCPADKTQAFLWDATQRGLGLRVTPAGKPAFVFQSEFQGRTIRVTIGSPIDWPISRARERARELQTQIDGGRDPREVKAEITAADVAKRELARRQSVTVGEAWSAYIEERRPFWSEHHIDDHLKLAQLGGEARGNRKGVKTIPGPLAALMPLELRALDAATVQAWAARETPKRPARARLALRLLKAFLRWSAAEDAFKDVADPTAASSKKAREVVGTAKPKNDHLQREQLGPWFDSVRRIPNQVISAYLQCLLLTGARREELAGLRWEDVSFQWNSIAMRDKIEGERMVPLTPYVASLMRQLPRANEWVFSSARFVIPVDGDRGHWENVSESGHLAEPSIAHRRACAAAGLEGLTLHGLRRSFASLCEWIEVPGGISAQIQGHAPQGVREQNYIRRPLDLLRSWHEKIEAWMLDQAGVAFEPKAAGGPRLASVA